MRMSLKSTEEMGESLRLLGDREGGKSKCIPASEAVCLKVR